MPLRPPVARPGHALTLLESGAQTFPALVADIDRAEREVWLETYIFDFHGAGADVAQALERAARRNLDVRVLVDGFGTGAPPPEWRQRFAEAGVRWEVFSPVSGMGFARPRSWRRLHRKLCTIDGRLAYCGGINVLDDWYDPNYGRLEAPRLDFAVRFAGPVVDEVRQSMLQLWERLQAVRTRDAPALADSLLRGRRRMRAAQRGEPAAGTARLALLLRDNLRHRRLIERAYLRAIGRAQQEVIIANAYFIPGGRLRRALARAARRGVRVTLLLQGRYEYFMQYYASRLVYGTLLQAGVSIHEYSASFLHAKVAVFDARVATVGSSNLDPLSLLLAREANVLVEDGEFAGALRERLCAAIADQGVALDPAQFARRPWRQRALEAVALVLMRLALLVGGKKYL